MFHLEEFYREAQSGEDVNPNGVLQYIRSFKTVVLWGASYLGRAIGERLQNEGIKINYWDMRADEIVEVNGEKVTKPFSEIDKSGTLIIYCIGNNVITPQLLHKLSIENYKYVLRGDFLYMGIICPFNKSSNIESEWCFGTMCCRCIFCKRLSNIVRNKHNKNNKDDLHTFSITLIINSICTLKCKYCTSYMNAYPKESRKNVRLERIFEDIDKFFDAMDSIGTVTIMGGEPFLHPGIAAITKKLLEKKNFGLVSIASSGTCPIRPYQLDGLQDKRVNVSFSNYLESITDKQRGIFWKNVETVKSANVAYTIGKTMPEWLIPSTLYDLHDTESIMIRKKSVCVEPLRCMQIKNGKLHPCDFGTALYSLQRADYSMDYLDIEKSTSRDELRRSIKMYIDQPYYRVCGHCAGGLGLTAKAGEQGFMDFLQPVNCGCE